MARIDYGSGGSTLIWRCENGVWFGNGFRVERLSTRAWALFDEPGVNEADVPVMVESLPIVTLPTMYACKYKAESLHERELQARLRKRLGFTAVVMGVLTVFAAAIPVIAIGFGVLAVAAVLELLMTWMDPVFGDAREVSQ